MQQALMSNLKSLKVFLNYTRNYCKRKFTLKTFKNEVVAVIKDAFAINKKRKRIRNKLRFQMHQLNQMERLIAQNNEHTFLRGNKFNIMR